MCIGMPSITKVLAQRAVSDIRERAVRVNATREHMLMRSLELNDSELGRAPAIAAPRGGNP